MHRIAQVLAIIFAIDIFLILVCGTFFPSYTKEPLHYRKLRDEVNRSPTREGSANANKEKVFIATTLYDPAGELITSAWGASVKGLIDILGPENVHLSIYENDATELGQSALAVFQEGLACDVSIVDEPLDFSLLPHVTLPDGTQRLKRMTFLAEVRNRALRPLSASTTRFDKLLYLNDVVFDPVDAANLLFSTNTGENGKAQYRAACAVDFDNPFKFYDTFATRDTEGYNMGVIFYPWFAGGGDAVSRHEVLSQSDAVRVKSCWGGMVAFDAQWFQYSEIAGADTTNVELPLRFRAENDTWWDASECCLIHADLAALTTQIDTDHGIYMNPYIRVAYTQRTLNWIWISRRIERLYTPAQAFVNWIAGRPSFNPRRLEQPGEEVTNKVWVWDAATQAALQTGKTDDLSDAMHGEFKEIRRVARPGSFCGSRSLSYLVLDAASGEKHWRQEHVPEGG